MTRRVLVTGAASALGTAIADRFAATGARVAARRLHRRIEGA